MFNYQITFYLRVCVARLVCYLFYKSYIEYGVGNIGRDMSATIVDKMRTTLRMRYKTQLSMAAWKGYANLLLDRTNYVGTCHTAPNRVQIRQNMFEVQRAHGGTFRSIHGARNGCTNVRARSMMIINGSVNKVGIIID